MPKIRGFLGESAETYSPAHSVSNSVKPVCDACLFRHPAGFARTSEKSISYLYASSPLGLFFVTGKELLKNPILFYIGELLEPSLISR